MPPDAAPATARRFAAAAERRRWRQSERRLSRAAAREREVVAEILAGRTKRGRPLSRRGLARLLDELRELHFREALAVEEGLRASNAVAELDGARSESSREEHHGPQA